MMVQFWLPLAEMKGLASLEPPDKLSTGQFSPADKLLNAIFS